MFRLVRHTGESLPGHPSHADKHTGFTEPHQLLNTSAVGIPLVAVEQVLRMCLFDQEVL